MKKARRLPKFDSSGVPGSPTRDYRVCEVSEAEIEADVAAVLAGIASSLAIAGNG